MESYSTHTQSRKHDVQEVSKASEAVYGEDKLERWLGKSWIAYREILPVFESKKRIVNALNWQAFDLY